jgi:hypothetical protein
MPTLAYFTTNDWLSQEKHMKKTCGKTCGATNSAGHNYHPTVIASSK